MPIREMQPLPWCTCVQPSIRHVLSMCMVAISLVNLARAAPLNSSSLASDLPQAVNTTGLEAHEWPKHLSLPIAYDAERYGSLEFENIGAQAPWHRAADFQAFIGLLDEFVPDTRYFQNFVGVIEGGSLVKDHSLFFILDLNPIDKASKQRPFSVDAVRVLNTANQAIKKYGLAEFTSRVVGSPDFTGGLQLLLEPTTSMPRQDQILLLVPDPVEPVMLQIFQYGELPEPAQDAEKLLGVLQSVAHMLEVEGPFESAFFRGAYTFLMASVPTEGGRPISLSNSLMLRVVKTLYSFSVGFKSTLQLVVYMRRGHGISEVVRGYLKKTVRPNGATNADSGKIGATNTTGKSSDVFEVV